jgi:hypothetical protein
VTAFLCFVMGETETQREDSLLTLQLRVARRADELARARAEPAGLNLHCWLLAEREVLSGTLTDWIAEPARPTAGVSAEASHANV